jgi:hypothetical protein
VFSVRYEIKIYAWFTHSTLANIMLIFLRFFSNLLVTVCSFKLSLPHILHQIVHFNLKNRKNNKVSKNIIGDKIIH